MGPRLRAASLRAAEEVQADLDESLRGLVGRTGHAIRSAAEKLEFEKEHPRWLKKRAKKGGEWRPKTAAEKAPFERPRQKTQAEKSGFLRKVSPEELERIKAEGRAKQAEKLLRQREQRVKSGFTRVVSPEELERIKAKGQEKRAEKLERLKGNLRVRKGLPPEKFGPAYERVQRQGMARRYEGTPHTEVRFDQNTKMWHPYRDGKKGAGFRTRDEAERELTRKPPTGKQNAPGGDQLTPEQRRRFGPGAKGVQRAKNAELARQAGAGLKPLGKRNPLTTADRNALPSSDFVFPRKRKYPIHDEAHARSALSYISKHGTKAEQQKVQDAVKARYPNITVKSTPHRKRRRPVAMQQARRRPMGPRLEAKLGELEENILGMLGRSGKKAVLSGAELMRFKKLHPTYPKGRGGKGGEFRETGGVPHPADFRGSAAEYRKTLSGRFLYKSGSTEDLDARVARVLAPGAAEREIAAAHAEWERYMSGKAQPPEMLRRARGANWFERQRHKDLLADYEAEPSAAKRARILSQTGVSPEELRSVRGKANYPEMPGIGKPGLGKGLTQAPMSPKQQRIRKALGAANPSRDASGVHFLGGWKLGEGGPVTMRYDKYESDRQGTTIHQLTNEKGEVVARGPRDQIGPLAAEHSAAIRKHRGKRNPALREADMKADVPFDATTEKKRKTAKVKRRKRKPPPPSRLAEVFEEIGAVAAGDPERLAEVKLTMAMRKALPKSAFVFPERAPAVGSYPIHDAAHARAALHYAKGKKDWARVRATVLARYPGLAKTKLAMG